MKKILVWLGFLTAFLFYCADYSQSFADAPKNQISVPDTNTVSGSDTEAASVSDNLPDTVSGSDTEEASVSGNLPEETGKDAFRQLDIDGVIVTSSMAELDLSGHNLAELGIDLHQIFEMFPNLTRVNLCQTGFTNEEYAALQDAFPDIRMIWEIVWHHWTFRTDVVAFSTLKTCAQSFFLYDEDAQYLRYCTDLVALDLGHNHVHDWSFLQYMPNLKILIAVDNQVEDLSWIRYTPKLEYLEFFVGRITDLSFLQYTPNMVDLNISYNPVSDASYLYNLPKLERLWMEHTRISPGEFQKLQEAHPGATIVYEGEGSIDQGWRSHERYSAMLDMFYNNYVHELFMD